MASNDDNAFQVLVSRTMKVHSALVDMNTILTSMLHDFQMAQARCILDEELGFWILLRSTTWSLQFLMHEYSDERWVSNFRLTKAFVFRVAAVLVPHCEHQDTWYRKAIHVRVHVAVALYKLMYGASLLICYELFAIGISTLSGFLRDIVHSINIHFRDEIQFPQRNCFLSIMHDFEEFCELHAVAGAIDGSYIHIRKPYIGPEDCFYFKISGYSIQMHAVVDRHKRFLDVAVGMHGSTHDS